MDLLSEQGLRLDGRRADELRNIRCKLGVFSQPDRSAYLEQGNTKVLAAVYGPHQKLSAGTLKVIYIMPAALSTTTLVTCNNVQLTLSQSRNTSRQKVNQDKAIVNCQYSMATFSTGERKRRPRGDRKSQETSMHLRQALEAAIRTDLYPRSQIDIFVEVLQADGGNYCASVNAATLALVDAGIPMIEYAVACSASLANGGVPLVDINHLEESSGGPNLTVVALPLSGQIVLLEMSQRFHIDHLQKVKKKALEGCKDIHRILDEAVRKHTEESGRANLWSQTERASCVIM